MIECRLAAAYYGGGRRWFTLEAACKAEANKNIRKWLADQGEDIATDEWFRPRRDRLAGMYKARWKRLNGGSDARN